MHRSAGDAAREGSVEAAVRYLESGFWPARRLGSLGELDTPYADWRDDVCNRRRRASEQRLEEERRALRPLPPERLDSSAGRIVRVPADDYLRHGGCFYRAPTSLVQQRVELRSNRDEVSIRVHGSTVAIYRRCYTPATWLPAPVLRPEPPAAAPPARLSSLVTPPEPADDADLRAGRRTGRRSASSCPTCSRSRKRRASCSDWSRRRSGPAPSSGAASSFSTPWSPPS